LSNNKEPLNDEQKKIVKALDFLSLENYGDVNFTVQKMMNYIKNGMKMEPRIS